MKITIISVGKIKEKYHKEAINEYTKRLSAFCKLKFIEVSDEKAPENLSKKEELMVKEKEGERILSKIKKSQYVFALDLDGKQRASEEFSAEINDLQLHGKSDVVFIIGGSLGLSQEVLNHSKQKISFSKMTFPHQMMKVILLEQIYRAYKIMNGEPYHK